MKRPALFLAALLTAVTCFAQEAPNPFTARDTRPPSGVFTSLTSGASAFIFSVMAPVQKMLSESLASMTRALKGSQSLGGLLLVAALALAYGIFHAAGPGMERPSFHHSCLQMTERSGRASSSGTWWRPFMRSQRSPSSLSSTT